MFPCTEYYGQRASWAESCNKQYTQMILLNKIVFDTKLMLGAGERKPNSHKNLIPDVQCLTINSD